MATMSLPTALFLLPIVAATGCGDRAQCNKDDASEERWFACDRVCRSEPNGEMCARRRELAWRLCADRKLPTFCAKACGEGNLEACAKK